MYYRNKIQSLQKIFGTNDLELQENTLRVGKRVYPIRHDVIDLTVQGTSPHFAEDIQYTFGEEWKSHHEVLPEHRGEFAQYFDLIDLRALKNALVCDLGCGSGRWSAFLKEYCRELIMVDFSEAIYVARENLRDADNAIFLRADITALPLADNMADFLFCLGVLHHLPIPCLDAVRLIKRLAPKQLIFLYYALDNRPAYFRWILQAITGLRGVLAQMRLPAFRAAFSLAGAVGVYLPLVWLGRLFDVVGLGRYVPLYEFYKGKSIGRIQQDVYDRFFTRIEQRVSRADIRTLEKDFSRVTISDHLPYWHFLLER